MLYQRVTKIRHSIYGTAVFDYLKGREIIAVFAQSKSGGHEDHR